MVQRASSVSRRGAARGLAKMKDEDDSGDEAEARHLLAKRREQAKYDAVRGDSAGPRLSSSKPTLSI